MTDIGFGLLTPAQDWDSTLTPGEMRASLEEWARLAGCSYDDIAAIPVLHRIGKTRWQTTVVRMLSFGYKAALYITANDEPHKILAGDYDEELRNLAGYVLPSTIVRAFHEPNGFEASPWTGWSPDTWAAVSTHVYGILGGRSFVCFIRKAGISANFNSIGRYAKALEARGFMPDIVGFDSYVAHPKRPNGMPVDVAERFESLVQWLPTWFPDSSIAIGEFGVAPGKGRRKVIRSLARLENVEFVVYMDWPDPNGDDYQLRGAIRTLGRLMR